MWFHSPWYMPWWYCGGANAFFLIQISHESFYRQKNKVWTRLYAQADVFKDIWQRNWGNSFLGNRSFRDFPASGLAMVGAGGLSQLMDSARRAEGGGGEAFGTGEGELLSDETASEKDENVTNSSSEGESCEEEVTSLGAKAA